MPRLKRYVDEVRGVALQDLWLDIKLMHNLSTERTAYPTQKPEELLNRIIKASSNEGDIVLDAFAGSGTTAAVAEKLGRRSITMDCGKLAIYTIQQRLFTLTTNIGGQDGCPDGTGARGRLGRAPEGCAGRAAHHRKGVRGECEVTPALLADLAALAVKHGLVKRAGAPSLACPRARLHVPEDQLEDADPEAGPGEKQITVDGVTFRISFVEAKDKPEKEKPLPAHEFALYRGKNFTTWPRSASCRGRTTGPSCSNSSACANNPTSATALTSTVTSASIRCWPGTTRSTSA